MIRARGVEELLRDQTWYRLEIPPSDFGFSDPGSIRRWEEIALALLRKYTRRLEAHMRSAWERPHLEYRSLDGRDPNLLGVGESRTDGY